MKYKFTKILGAMGIWVVVKFVLVLLEYEININTGYLSLFILFLIFHYLGKRNSLNFSFLKSKVQVKNRIPEVIAAYGWKELMRCLFLLCLTLIFMSLKELPELSGSYLPEVESSFDLMNLVVITGILAPIVEEFAFRGVIFDLTKDCNRRKAMIFNVVLFSVLHLTSLSIINAFFAGIALYELREKNNDIVSCIMLHMLINLIAILNKLGFQSLIFMIMFITILYYLYSLYVWKKTKDKTEVSKRNLCVKN